MRRSAADITRAKALLGWQPQIDRDAGMRATIDWARESSRLR
jgi:nucleoside-diphosphate-sugar epimerase